MIITIFARPNNPLTPKARSRNWITLIPLVITVVVYTLLNLKWSGTIPSGGDCSLGQEPRTNLIERYLYAPLMNSRFTPASWPQVEVVTLSADVEPPPVLNNVCIGRQFLTDLVARLAEQGAAVIAIDKYFSDKSCTDKRDQGIDEAFRATLLKASSITKIILGQSAHRRPNAISESDCLVVDPPFTLNKQETHRYSKPEVKPDSHPILFGLTRLNQNALRIPLQWWAFDNNVDAANLNDPADKHLDGFALAASEALDPQMKYREDLKLLLARSEHPYGSFSKSISKSNAIDVLCVGISPQQSSGYKWGSCPQALGKISDFRGKLVVVGQLSEQDRTEFIGGKEEYGLFVQANYIGSLLGDRYVHRVPVWLDVLMLFVLAVLPVVIDNLFPSEFSKSWHAFIIILATVVVFIVSGLISLFLFQTFAPISFLSLYGVGGLLITLLAIRILSYFKEKHYRIT